MVGVKNVWNDDISLLFLRSKWLQLLPWHTYCVSSIFTVVIFFYEYVHRVFHIIHIVGLYGLVICKVDRICEPIIRFDTYVIPLFSPFQCLISNFFSSVRS